MAGGQVSRLVGLEVTRRKHSNSAVLLERAKSNLVTRASAVRLANETFVIASVASIATAPASFDSFAVTFEPGPAHQATLHQASCLNMANVAWNLSAAGH